MNIIGTPLSSVQYRFIAKTPLIDGPQLLGLGIHEKIMKEFTIDDFIRPRNPEKDSIKLENGQVTADGKTYSISKIVIANVGLQSIVWGPTTVAEKVIEKVLNIIELNLPAESLRSHKKVVKYDTVFKARLDVNHEQFFAKALIPIFMEFSNQIPKSNYSKTELHFPLIGAAVVTKPNLEAILKNVASDQLEAEIEAASITRRISIAVPDTESYDKKLFEVNIEADLATAISLLEKIEKTFKGS